MTTDRLGTLEEHASKTEGRLGIIEGVQHTHGEKLDQIVNAVTRHDARPVFDMAKTVTMVAHLFVIGATVATLSVWLILILTAANDKVVEVELRITKERLNETRDMLRDLANVTLIRKSASGN